jgi:hypothetical protein
VQFIRERAANHDRLATRFTDTTVAFRAVKGCGQLGSRFFDEFVKELGTTGKTRLFQSELGFPILNRPRLLIATRAQGKAGSSAQARRCRVVITSRLSLSLSVSSAQAIAKARAGNKCP